MSRKPLVFAAKDGLGNRLRALVGFLTLAELEKTPLLLHWGTDGACDTTFENLFETPAWNRVRFIDAKEAAASKECYPERYHYTSVWFTDVWKQYAMDLCNSELFNRTAIGYLQSLRPRHDLFARIEHFARTRDLAQCTGVHIRMTDNVKAYDWWVKNDPDFVPDKVSRIDGFHSAIKVLKEKGERAFVCTDNQAIADQFSVMFDNLVMYRKEFRQQGFEYHMRKQIKTENPMRRAMDKIKAGFGITPPSTWRTTPVADALVEMMLLSRCRSIIGTYYSSFSQVSALIGNIPLHRLEGTTLVKNKFVHDLQKTIRMN